jgi:PAS domain S-box-containing protein
MEKPAGRALRLLLVEDSEADAELLLRELGRGGYAVASERVEDAASMKAALARATWDLVISDCSMPNFSAFSALGLVRGAGGDLPFIVISGTLDEDDASELFRAGASDFLVKGKLARLLPAVERELQEKKARDAERRSEARIKVSEERFRRLLESAPDAMVIAVDDDRIGLVNGQTEMLFGYSREELIGQPIEILVPPRYRAANRAGRTGIFAQSDSRPMGTGLEIFALRKDLTEFPAEISLSLASTAEGGVLTVAIRDITKRRRTEQALQRTEEQLRQAQKMEAVGALAAGVAHDFNNILSIVLSYAGFVLDQLAPSDQMHADVEEIRKAGERAVHLTRQLLAFSRQQAVDPRVVSLNEIARGLEKMLRRVGGEAVELTFIPAHSLGMVRADPGHIEQVLMNLVVNARDAMPTGGQITIETANVDLDEVYASAHPGLASGQYVTIGVSDTGTGMDAATRERVFEPFFTTKEMGKGTGLGLSVVYGIVKQSGGYVHVNSETGKGTTFTVYLPRIDEDVPESILPPPPLTTLRGSEAILLVEGDEQLRAIEATILRRSGYSVVEAQNGGEAFLACERHQGAIGLLLTDVVMPRMNGIELATRLAPMQPQMRVLYMSGRVDNSRLHEQALSSGAYLQKPITPDSLLRKVREVLDFPRAQASGGAMLTTSQ